jgi:hypothetical protein
MWKELRNIRNKEEDETSDDSFVFVDGPDAAAAAAPFVSVDGPDAAAAPSPVAQPVASSPVAAQPTAPSPVAQSTAPSPTAATAATAPNAPTAPTAPTATGAPSPQEKLQCSITSKVPIATSFPSSADTTIRKNQSTTPVLPHSVPALVRRRTRSGIASPAAGIDNTRASASWTKTISKLVRFAAAVFLLMTCLRLLWSGSNLGSKNSIPQSTKKTPTRPERRNIKNIENMRPQNVNQDEVVIEFSQLSSFVANHTHVLVVVKEKDQWKNVMPGSSASWRSFIPIHVAVARLDCGTLHPIFSDSASCRNRGRFSWYENGQIIDNFGGTNLVGFIRAMLALSRDETTQKAIANLPNGVVGQSVENLRYETEKARKKVERHRREGIGFLDDGDDWAMKADDEVTRLFTYKNWFNTRVRYLVNEAAFGSFLLENKKQAFVLFSYTGEQGGGRMMNLMEVEKIRQLVSVMPYAEVTCDVTPRLCLGQNITTYLTLRSYINGTADPSELTVTPRSDASYRNFRGAEGTIISKIVSWVSRHSKVDQFSIDFDDTEVFVVSPSNISSFVREHKYVFLYVHEEGFSSAAVEQLLHELSKRVSRFPLVVAKLSVPSPSMDNVVPPAPFVNRWNHQRLWQNEDHKTWSWLNVVGPSGRSIYFFDHMRLKRAGQGLVPVI